MDAKRSLDELIEFTKEFNDLIEYSSFFLSNILFFVCDNIKTEAQLLKIISKAFTFLVIFSEPIGIVIDFCPIVERF